jgi:hypothetical protein
MTWQETEENYMTWKSTLYILYQILSRWETRKEIIWKIWREETTLRTHS